MGKKITESEAIEKIKKLLVLKNQKLKTNLDFLGFVNNNWKGNTTKLILKCNKHNVVWETSSYNNFTKNNFVGCSKCRSESIAKFHGCSSEDAYRKVMKIHKDNLIYDYSKIKTTYTGSHNKVTITCLKHGDFKINYYVLLRGSQFGLCPKCLTERTIERSSISKNDAILTIRNKINYIKNKYNIDLEFLGFKEELEGLSIKNRISYSYLKLRCKKHNLIWDTTSYSNFIHSDCIFCPSCSKHKQMSNIERKCFESLKTIIKDRIILEQFHLNSIFDKITNNFRDIVVDFYIPDYNTFIEVDGEQHYKYIPSKYHKKGYQYYVDRINRDKCLVDYCLTNNINLLKIPWCDISNIDSIIEKYFTTGEDITTKVQPKLLPIKYEEKKLWM